MINDCYHSRIGCREYWEENCEELGGELRRTVRDFLAVMTNRRRENESRRSRERRQSRSNGGEGPGAGRGRGALRGGRIGVGARIGGGGRKSGRR